MSGQRSNDVVRSCLLGLMALALLTSSLVENSPWAVGTHSGRDSLSATMHSQTVAPTPGTTPREHGQGWTERSSGQVWIATRPDQRPLAGGRLKSIKLYFSRTLATLVPLAAVRACDSLTRQASFSGTSLATVRLLI